MGIASQAYQWMLVDDFIEAFNDYRATNYSPSDRICVDESISRWYGLGGHGLTVGYRTMLQWIENQKTDARSRMHVMDGVK